jgi:hypothetical protein
MTVYQLVVLIKRINKQIATNVYSIILYKEKPLRDLRIYDRKPNVHLIYRCDTISRVKVPTATLIRDSSFLGCDVMLIGKECTTFRRRILPKSSVHVLSRKASFSCFHHSRSGTSRLNEIFSTENIPRPINTGAPKLKNRVRVSV